MFNLKANASDPQINFTISDRLDQSTVTASVTLSNNGLLKLDDKQTIKVNNVDLKVLNLRKQGFWYKNEINKNDKYLLEIMFDEHNVYKSVINNRFFYPNIPTTIGKDKNIEIPYNGNIIEKNERLYIVFNSLNLNKMWEVTPNYQIVGNNIFIESKYLNNIEDKEIKIYVGLTTKKDNSTYATGLEKIVIIIN